MDIYPYKGESILPICPKCGAVVKEGKRVCSCGTPINTTNDEELEHLLVVEAQKVEKFREIKAKCLEAFDAGEYQKSFDYSSEALDLGIGTDAELTFARGKSLYHLNRFLDSAICFDRYIHEYRFSFYRFSDIAEAYECKAEALWQLGNGFESIKCYYHALDHVDNKPCSLDEKMAIRTRINESRRRVMIYSADKEGVANPRLGVLDEKVYNRLEQYNPDVNVTMQSLYDAMAEVESEGYKFNLLFLKGNNLYVEFLKDRERIEKLFDGTSHFRS